MNKQQLIQQILDSGAVPKRKMCEHCKNPIDENHANSDVLFCGDTHVSGDYRDIGYNQAIADTDLEKIVDSTLSWAIMRLERTKYSPVPEAEGCDIDDNIIAHSAGIDDSITLLSHLQNND